MRYYILPEFELDDDPLVCKSRVEAQNMAQDFCQTPMVILKRIATVRPNPREHTIEEESDD